MSRNFSLFIFLFFLFSSHVDAFEKRIMIFGCFDLLHEGHKNFIEQAAQHGTVIAIVSRDSIIRQLKNREPIQSQEMRLKNIQSHPLIHQAFLGDEVLGEFSAIKLHKPDLIAIGYDQILFHDYLLECMRKEKIPTIPLIIMDSYFPEYYHTSIIREKLKL